MPYSIIGVRAAPESGFRSATRHTAQGAQDVAFAFQADGLTEIEIHDDRGRLCTMRDLENAERDDRSHRGRRPDHSMPQHP